MPPKKIKTIGEEPSCNICCNTYNKSTRKEISCNYCVDKACLECIKQFLLDTVTEYHCMFCKNKWSRDVLVEKLPQKFINEDLITNMKNRIINLKKPLVISPRVISPREIANREMNKAISIMVFMVAITYFTYCHYIWAIILLLSYLYMFIQV